MVQTNQLLKLAASLSESVLSSCPVIVGREEWYARDPISRVPLSEPVPMVIILETILPDKCYDEISCIEAVQYKQNFCMDNKGRPTFRLNL